MNPMMEPVNSYWYPHSTMLMPRIKNWRLRWEEGGYRYRQGPFGTMNLEGEWYWVNDLMEEGSRRGTKHQTT